VTVLLGRTSAGTTADFDAAGFPAAWKVTAAATGTLTSIYGWTKVANAGLTSIELGIYADDAGGTRPGTRLGNATTTNVEIKDGGAFAVTGLSVSITSGTVYWLAWRGVGEQFDWQGDASGAYVENAVSAALANPWPSANNNAGSVNNIIWGTDTAPVVFDAKSRSTATDTTESTANPQTWTHTPVGTPKAVIVTITQPDNTGDEVSGVTYGGVAMTRVRSDASTQAEAGRTYLYFLGTGIPTGAQTISVSRSATIAPQQHHAFTFTADGDTVVDSHSFANIGIVANPSTTATFTGSLENWAGVAAHLYGGAAPVSTGLQVGETYGFGHDGGNAVAMTYYISSVPVASSTTFGYTTLTSDDQAIGWVIVKPASPPPPNLSATLAGAGSLTSILTPEIGAALAGAGALTSILTPQVSATLAGQGSLTGDLTAPSGGPANLSATLVGAGSLTGILTPEVGATLAGAGNLSGQLTPEIGSTLAGQGSLTAKLTPEIGTTLAGQGSLTGILTPRVGATVTGTGGLSAILTPELGGSLAGAGSISGQLTPELGATVTGAGQLVGNLTVPGAAVLSATLIGAGSLTAIPTPQLGSTLAGQGAIVATTPAQLGATLAGQGTLTGALVTTITGQKLLLTIREQATGLAVVQETTTLQTVHEVVDLALEET